jgi:hypothetical protein
MNQLRAAVDGALEDLPRRKIRLAAWDRAGILDWNCCLKLDGSLEGSFSFKHLFFLAAICVDTSYKTLNRLGTFLRRFWKYYQSSPVLRKALN